ncbi:Predicted ABC-type transport system involved in lysophospholipase L1 biosynthesis, permease component [Arthrobacter sp. 49Tsu3.1M3]|uniref:ABC transporter permease n=1 Tax=Arthrobacter sp. 49Tsu3.1M3 TaxID=1279029 RepID=UPI0009A78DA4|nr:FtsX-like permease family protein [Arthrobacter sp. 49Tsu3.1M3]SKB82638.1 Predicted ABC-type transport system involved in lysophospholipase L1 biosynthesis, permease component [Arthrobacter sp. 49Tsu3.1M3]
MNAVQRFIRSRVLLLTASILIVAMCLSVLVQGQSQAALSRTVDQNSRGLYDVLVQAKAKDNGGLMQPDIATGQGGISFEQLDSIRKLSGTSVAAPISLVSRVTQNLESPRLDATDYLGFNAGLAGTSGDPTATDPSKWPAAESVLSDTPKKYRLTASAVSSDGHSDQTLFKTTAEGSLGKAKLVEEQVEGGKNVRIQGPAGETGIKFPTPAGGSEHNLFNLSVSLPMAPQVTESVVAVDPVSERALLGTAGDFLSPLEKAPPADARNAGAIGRHFESLFTNGISMDELKEGPDFLGVKLKYWAPLMTQYQQAKRDGQLTDDSQAIPLIVRSGTALDLKYSVKIEEIDDSGNVTKDVGTVTRSLDKDYLPFVSKSPFALAWPGSKDLSQLMGDTGSFSQGLYNPATWTTNFAAAPTYKDGETAANGAVDKSATPGDWVTVNRLPDKAANGEAVDQTQREPVDERSYRQNLETGKKLATPLAMVYGTFDAANVKEAAGDVNRLPLGGYDPAPFTLTKDASGKDANTELKPSLSATGLVSQSAGAITDYYGLAAARGYDANANVIDAVRVRAKVPGSWKQAQPEVEKLANEIRDMGLQATVVAGSAREDASIAVPGYSKDDAGKESPLGTVQQSWVRQDAADAVSGSLTATNLTLLFLTLCGAALLTGASTVSYIRKRRSEAGTLRAMGWTQRKIRSWVLAEFGVGAALLAVVGIVLSLISWSTATAVVSASVLVLYAGAAFVAAQQLRHRDVVDQEPQHDERLIAVDSPLTFANRQLSTNKFNTISLAVAVGVFAAAVGGLVALLIDIPRAAGASALSGLAAASIALPSIILGVSGVAVGLLLTMVTGRFELQAKRQYLGTLRAMGWNPDMLGQVRFFENAMVGTVALPLGVVGALGIGLLLAPYAALWAAIAGLVAVLCWIPIATKVVQ